MAPAKEFQVFRPRPLPPDSVVLAGNFMPGQLQIMSCDYTITPGELRNEDRSISPPACRSPGIWKVVWRLPPAAKTICAGADSGFYCGEAVEAYRIEK
jgi:hypothetical protein